jgi:hypothetical protein
MLAAAERGLAASGTRRRRIASVRDPAIRSDRDARQRDVLAFVQATLAWFVAANGTASAMHSRQGMSGCITSRDVVRRGFTIVRLWGPRCYLRCLKAVISRRPCTFLEILYAT